MTPQVSVVMPVRNGERWLGQTLDSLLAQTMGEFEVLVIDDGSTDSTPAILNLFAKRDPRIRVYRQDALGLVAALNRGLAEARAPLLGRLDADDRALPQRLERQTRYLAAHPGTGLLGSWAQVIDGNGRRGRLLRPETRADALQRVLLRTNPFVHSSIVMRTELVRRLGGYRGFFQAAEDYDLCLRVSEHATIANLPEVLIEYRRHGENVTSRLSVRQAFSSRLALHAAELRRRTGYDPSAGLTEPPDWRSAEARTAFYADDAALYRMLDLADPGIAPGARATVDFGPLMARFEGLNHAERSLAARAMINHMAHADRVHGHRTRALFLRLLLKRPGMVPRQVWSSLPAALLR